MKISADEMVTVNNAFEMMLKLSSEGGKGKSVKNCPTLRFAWQRGKYKSNN